MGMGELAWVMGRRPPCVAGRRSVPFNDQRRSFGQPARLYGRTGVKLTIGLRAFGRDVGDSGSLRSGITEKAQTSGRAAARRARKRHTTAHRSSSPKCDDLVANASPSMDEFSWLVVANSLESQGKCPDWKPSSAVDGTNFMRCGGSASLHTDANMPLSVNEKTEPVMPRSEGGQGEYSPLVRPNDGCAHV